MKCLANFSEKHLFLFWYLDSLTVSFKISKQAIDIFSLWLAFLVCGWHYYSYFSNWLWTREMEKNMMDPRTAYLYSLLASSLLLILIGIPITYWEQKSRKKRTQK